MQHYSNQLQKVGDRINTLTISPVSRYTLALYAGASGDHNPIHIDIDFAKSAGMKDVFAHGMLVMAYLSRALTDTVPQTSLYDFGVRFCSITQLRDELTCEGEVTDIENRQDGTFAQVDLKVADKSNDIKLSGFATIKINS